MIISLGQSINTKCQYISFMDCLPLYTHQHKAALIVLSTITVQERAPNVINSTLGPRVAVELEPDVCVVKLKDIVSATR